MYSAPEYHHVNLTVSQVSEMQADRNPQQNIKAIVHVKINRKQAEGLAKILQEHLDSYQDGMGPITFSLEGDFT